MISYVLALLLRLLLCPCGFYGGGTSPQNVTITSYIRASSWLDRIIMIGPCLQCQGTMLVLPSCGLVAGKGCTQGGSWLLVSSPSWSWLDSCGGISWTGTPPYSFTTQSKLFLILNFFFFYNSMYQLISSIETSLNEVN